MVSAPARSAPAPREMVSAVRGPVIGRSAAVVRTTMFALLLATFSPLVVSMVPGRLGALRFTVTVSSIHAVSPGRSGTPRMQAYRLEGRPGSSHAQPSGPAPAPAQS